MIPKLASPLRQGMNSMKNDKDKSEILENGILLRVKKLCAHRIFDKEKLEMPCRLSFLVLEIVFG